MAVLRMSDTHLDPARSVIQRLGGVALVATITGKSRSRVFRWMYPPSRGGTGGFIPNKDVPRLLAYAQEHGIALSRVDFVPSSPPAEAAE